MPAAVYCKYDVGHSFRTFEECNDHMKICPRRDEFKQKAAQCHEKFTSHKTMIRKQQEGKRRREAEFGGNINAPESNVLPMLRYQYRMNEPFIGGENRTVESSHAANLHKRAVAYDLE